MAGVPPGAEPYDDAFATRLDEAFAAKGEDYRARTRHKDERGEPRFLNRLILETSPYLLQHAHNPVAWYAWGDEAFEAARRLGRPVFLSVGYSTCHWCHVMEEESFEDEEVARFLNEHFIPVKVDREERPDVDTVYMTAVQALTGRGGWPMSVWLTPTREPFYGGTYFPARDGDRGPHIGFLTVLARLSEIYAQDPEKVRRSSADIAGAIRAELAPPEAADLPDEEVLDEALEQYRQRFDPAEGGLRVQQKFPSQLSLRFLLRCARRTQEEEPLRMAALTLEKMAAGGLYDHVAGGFHRYSTDPRWLVPHFEKMLYDNALLGVAYLEGYQATGHEGHARTAREVLRYVERDMTSPEGGFYSATDADSLAPNGEREEGWFFTWTPEELAAELGPERAKRVGAVYAVRPGGNFEGRSILHMPRPLEDVAKELGLDPVALRSEVDEAREQLYQARAERPAPLRDEKILTAWNGLMISALAKGALVLGEPRWAALGARAADFVLRHMREGGRLYRAYKDGAPRHAAYADDYAFLAAGLLDLFEATGEPRFLREALSLDDVLQRHFEDKDAGGLFLTADDHEELLVRSKPSYDGAEPSASSVHTHTLLRLALLTGDERYRARAEGSFRAFARVLEDSPIAMSELLVALDLYLDEEAREIVLVAPKERAELEPFLAELRQRFLPSAVLVSTAAKELDALAGLTPLVVGKQPADGATAFVCRQGACQLPAKDPATFAKQLS